MEWHARGESMDASSRCRAIRLTALMRSLPRGSETLKKYPADRDFTLLTQLGKGTFATVHMASPRRPGELRAAKIVDLTLGTNARDHTMLEDEIRTLRRLDHPNICGLHDCYLLEDSLTMILDLCQGGELFDRIVAKDHYSEREARVAFAQIVEAVGHCHRHEVVHRDVKPENLLYAGREGDPRGGLLKLCDFGLATCLAPDHRLHHACGSPAYCSPEIFKASTSGGGYKHATDLWSCGVVLYVMLSGYTPFGDDRALITAGAFAFHEEYWRNISADAKGLVSVLLSVDARKRPAAEGVFRTKWMKDPELTDAHIPNFSATWHKYKLRRKFKSAVLAVLADHRFETYLSGRFSSQLTPPSFRGEPTPPNSTGGAHEQPFIYRASRTRSRDHDQDYENITRDPTRDTF